MDSDQKPILSNPPLRLKLVRRFEAFAGEQSLGVFKVESEWNGMTKLVGEDGKIILASIGRDIWAQMFGDDETSTTAALHMASPSVLATIQRAGQK